MSLEELRKQVEAEENQEVTEEQEELELGVAETETEESEEAEEAPEETEEVDDLELELEGEPEAQKPERTPEQVLTYKLTKERKKRQAAKSENEELREEINQLKAMMAQPQAPAAQPQAPTFEYGSPAPVPPDRYSPDINGDERKLAIAHAQYMKDWNDWQQAQIAPQVKAQAEAESMAQMIKKKTEVLSSNAAKFIGDNKVKPEIVIDAIETARDEIDAHTGLDGSLVHLLEAVGDESGKVAYYIGRNAAARDRLKALLSEDPAGLKAVNYLTNLSRLKPKAKTQSKAPAPDEPVKGDAGSVSASQLKASYDKEDDPQKMLAMRKRARELGVSLD